MFHVEYPQIDHIYLVTNRKDLEKVSNLNTQLVYQFTALNKIHRIVP